MIGSCEATLAKLAFVAAVVGVNGHVTPFVFGPRKLLVTQIALEGFVASVSGIMSLQMELNGVCFVTTIAVILTISRLDGLAYTIWGIDFSIY